MSKKKTAGGNDSTYTTECYLREVTMQIESPRSRSIEIVCDPGEGWQVEHDSKKYIILEGKAMQNVVTSILLEKLTCKINDADLFAQLVQAKLDKARIRLRLSENGNEYKVKAITLI